MLPMPMPQAIDRSIASETSSSSMAAVHADSPQLCSANANVLAACCRQRTNALHLLDALFRSFVRSFDRCSIGLSCNGMTKNGWMVGRDEDEEDG